MKSLLTLMMRMKSSTLIKWLSFIWVPFTWAAIHYEKVDELQLMRTYVLDTESYPERLDLSGLTSDGTSLYSISDLSDQNDLWRIELTPKPRVVKVASLQKAWLDKWQTLNASKGRYDTEGIAFCNGRFYLAEETTRSVLEIELVEGTYIPKIIAPNWTEFHARKNVMNPFSGVANAGLEAIACHPDKGSVFIFNERQFRMGYQLNLASGQLHHQFTIPSGLEFPSQVGQTWVFPDFAGAHLHEGFLYLLVRNRQQIVKVSVDTFKVIKRWTYGDMARRIFRQQDAFGLAEGLAIHQNSFFIVLDHNLWEHAATGRRNPVLLRLKPYEDEL